MTCLYNRYLVPAYPQMPQNGFVVFVVIEISVAMGKGLRREHLLYNKPGLEQ